MPEVSIQGSQGVGAVVIKAGGSYHHDGSEWTQYDVVTHLHTEVNAWTRAIEGAVGQFMDDAQHGQRDKGLRAVETAVEKFNGALRQLVEAVYAEGTTQ